jgi:hypothetical protein
MDEGPRRSFLGRRRDPAFEVRRAAVPAASIGRSAIGTGPMSFPVVGV